MDATTIDVLVTRMQLWRERAEKAEAALMGSEREVERLRVALATACREALEQALEVARRVDLEHSCESSDCHTDEVVEALTRALSAPDQEAGR